MSTKDEKIDALEDLSDEVIDKIADKLYQKLVKYFDEEDCDCEKEITPKSDEDEDEDNKLPKLDLNDEKKEVELPEFDLKNKVVEQISKPVKLSKMLSVIFESTEFTSTEEDSVLYVDDIVVNDNGYTGIEIGDKVFIIDLKEDRISVDLSIDGSASNEISLVVKKKDDTNFGLKINNTLIRN